MTDQEFGRRCAGMDRCDRCFLLRPVAPGSNRRLPDWMLELYPDGQPGFYCRGCLEELEETATQKDRMEK